MIAPTHCAFSIAIAYTFGLTTPEALVLMGVGSLLPDIDNNRSIMGRVLYFFSVPLNKKFGHSGFIHSLVLWLPPMVIGLLYFKPIAWLCFGAVTHIILDTWNIAGVQMLKPVSEKVYVMSNRKYRIASGSRNDIILLVILIFFVALGGWMDSKGGLRKLTQKFIGDYATAIQHYEREGLKICYLHGKLRQPNGVVNEGDFLIVGKNDGANVTVLDEKKDEMFEIPKDGEFLKAYLKTTSKYWQTMKCNEPLIVQKGIVYYRIDKKWHRARIGDVVAGFLVYDGEIELTKYEF